MWVGCGPPSCFCNYLALGGSILTSMKNVLELDESNFEPEVLKAHVPVVVEFYAPWCGPCKMIAPLLEQLAVEFQGRIKFTKVNVDHAPGLAGRYEVSGVPTLAYFRDGQLVDRLVGFGGAKALKFWLENAVLGETAELGNVVNGRLP